MQAVRVAAGLGLEPRLPDPESGVLPLDDPAKRGHCSRGAPNAAPCPRLSPGVTVGFVKRYQRDETVWKRGFRLKRFARPGQARVHALRKKGYVRDLDAYKKILDSLK